MKVVLLRVGIDSGSGGMQGPIFADGSFELIPIPDTQGVGLTYGEVCGTKGVPLSDYFPASRRAQMRHSAMHLDPEFSTFTYGDPTKPKSSLRRLDKGDLLVFYAGLEGWDHSAAPALYIVGYFIVEWAGCAGEHSDADVMRHCSQNFHVVHEPVYQKQRERLVLVRGGLGSRLLSKAYCISTMGTDSAGQALKVLSLDAQKIFGDFGGRISLQRSPPRWVSAEKIERAKAFVLGLP